jgi:hypothetical protein
LALNYNETQAGNFCSIGATLDSFTNAEKSNSGGANNPGNKQKQATFPTGIINIKE